MIRYIPLALAFLASVYVGSLFSPDPVTLLSFSITVLLTLVLAILIRLAWSKRLYRKLERPSDDEGDEA